MRSALSLSPRGQARALRGRDTPPGDAVVLVCAGAVVSSPDRLGAEVPLQQCGASKVPLTLGGRRQEDTGQPAGSVAWTRGGLAVPRRDV